MQPPQRRRRHRGGLRRKIRRLNRFQVVAASVAAVAAVVGATALILAINPSPPAGEGPGEAPPLRLTPSPGVSSAAAPGTPSTVRLVIPGGHIDIQVAEGDGLHVPLNLALHYPGTSWPGGGGNSLFYAHAQPGMFLGLYSLHVGDEVRAYRADGTQLVYQVRTLRKVNFDDDRVTRPTAFEEVTLLTCTSYNPRNPRYIVTATPA